MKHARNLVKTFALAALVSATSMACAEKFYLGAGAGMSHLNIECADDNNCDDTDSAFKAYAGYKFNNVIGIEAIYMNFGDWVIGTGGVAFGGAPEIAKFSAKAYGVAGTLFSEFNQHFTGYVRFGVLATKTQTTPPSRPPQSKSSYTPMVGAGVDLTLAKGLAIRTDIDLTALTFDSRNTGYEDNGGAQLITIGISYHF